MPTHETVDQRLHYVYQEGRTVFKHAVMDMSDAVELVAKRNNLTKDDIAWIIPHQANVRIESAVARRIGVEENHIIGTLRQQPICPLDMGVELVS